MWNFKGRSFDLLIYDSTKAAGAKTSELQPTAGTVSWEMSPHPSTQAFLLSLTLGTSAPSRFLGLGGALAFALTP